MAEMTVLAAERREKTGKGPARQLRRAGRIPGIIYGGADEPLKISLIAKDVKRELDMNAHFFTAICEVDLGDHKVHVLPRETQLHPVTDLPWHVDFMRAEGASRLTVAVPVRFINETACPGLRRGGTLNIVRREIEVACPANAIPAEITIDLTGFDINDSIHASHVQFPAQAQPTITDRDFTIASIVPPTVSEEEVSEEPDEEA